MTNQANILAALLKLKENSQCCDCTNKNPRWASTTFGSFMCIRCAGFHRRLGTSITKVRSVNLDKWTQDMLDLYQNINNQIANDYWERNLPRDFQRPNENTTDSNMWQFINNKYVKKKFAPSGTLDPATEYNQRKNGGEPTAQQKDHAESHIKEETSIHHEKALPFDGLLIDELKEVSVVGKHESKSLDINLLSFDDVVADNSSTNQRAPLNFNQIKDFYGQPIKQVQSANVLQPKQALPYKPAIKPEVKLSVANKMINDVAHKEKQKLSEKVATLGGFDVGEFLSSMQTPPKVSTNNRVVNTKCFDDIPTNW